MRKRITILMLAGLILGLLVAPSFALSDLAERFLISCTAVGSPSPLERWDKMDLRDAAIEVLGEIENNGYDKWPLVFCLNSIGMAQYPEDIHRITAYKDEMIYVVLGSLRGFPHKDAIDFLLKYVDHKEATVREVAVHGLKEIDFMNLRDAYSWHDIILKKLENARKVEEEKWMREELDKAIEKLKSAELPRKKQK